MFPFVLQDAPVDPHHLAIPGERLARRLDHGPAQRLHDLAMVVDDEVGHDVGEQVQSLAVLEDGLTHDPGQQRPEVVLVGDLAPRAVARPHVDVMAALLQPFQHLARVGPQVQIPGNEATVDVEEDVERPHER